VEVRPFDRARDLDAVLEMVAASRAKEEPGAIFHPGGLQWWVRRVGRPSFDVAVLVENGRVVGFALHDEGDVVLQTEAGHAAARADLVAWVEERARILREPEIFISVAEADDDLRDELQGRGYEPSDRYGYELVFDLATEQPVQRLPPGFAMRSLSPEVTDRYIELHRAAWSRPGRPSSYDRAQHDAVVAMPDFRYEMVPIAVASDGTFAAYCMSWWDPRTRSVEIEPLGTHPAFRRLGLARAIVHEVFARAALLGAAYVLVWGASGNPEARALYLSAGMRAVRVIRDHRLAL
jgi:GNAT superfamily N-acetyltransferase